VRVETGHGGEGPLQGVVSTQQIDYENLCQAMRRVWAWISPYWKGDLCATGRSRPQTCFSSSSFRAMSGAKVYTVNGASAGSATSLPDWLTRKRAQKSKGRRGAVKEEIAGAINVIQNFEFPEASNRIRVTADGHHALATGTYKPQVKCFDLEQLTQKWERHSDAENVDFVVRFLEAVLLD